MVWRSERRGRAVGAEVWTWKAKEQPQAFHGQTAAETATPRNGDRHTTGASRGAPRTAPRRQARPVAISSVSIIHHHANRQAIKQGVAPVGGNNRSARAGHRGHRPRGGNARAVLCNQQTQTGGTLASAASANASRRHTRERSERMKGAG